LKRLAAFELSSETETNGMSFQDKKAGNKPNPKGPFLLEDKKFGLFEEHLLFSINLLEFQ
jgi:hypothetical protein